MIYVALVYIFVFIRFYLCSSAAFYDSVILFHNKKHPARMGKKEIESFLSHLAVDRKVSASTQRQALNALVFLYHRVLDKPLQGEIEPIRSRRKPKLPVVLTQAEVKKVLGNMNGVHLLMAQLLYGAGLQKAVKVAVTRAGITKRVTCHTFRQLRHSPPGKRRQYPRCTRIDGTRQRQNHRDIYARDGKGPDGRS
jgi:site-specific recombinase XerD